MNLLVVGGSGYVARLIMPLLAQRHTVRIYDLQPPADTTLDYHYGDVSDFHALIRAAEGMDGLLYMAMGVGKWNTNEAVSASFDVNVKGVHLALQAAHQAGITHAVYTSSMSVYEGRLETRSFPDEDLTPDSRQVYGFTKRLGELVCHNAAREWGMTINALRLCHPTPDDEWLAKTRLGKPTIATTATDTANAILAALDHRGSGFQAFMISGDYEQKIMNMSRAQRYLHWQPQSRPQK